MFRQQCTSSRLRCSSHQQKKVACEMEPEVDIECEVFNKSQSIPVGTFLSWFVYTLPFETSGTASCGTTGNRSLSQLVAVIMASSSSKGAEDGAAAVVAEESSPEPMLPREQDIHCICSTAVTFKEFKKRVYNIDVEKVKPQEEQMNEKIQKQQQP